MAIAFRIYTRRCKDATWGKWFQIWESIDGEDTAKYLADLAREGRDEQQQFCMAACTTNEVPPYLR